MIAALCSIICFKSLARTVPYNYLILLVFTLSLSFNVMFATTRYDATEVLMAAGLTTVMVLSLTLYAFCTKEDITVSRGSIPVVSTVFAFVSIYYLFNQ
jgi:FtsH-binding integral membrane protein